jgi:hypothetical protein
VVDIDLAAPAHDAEPFELFDQLREIGPVVRSDRHRAWLAVTHEAVVDGLRAPWLSSNRVPTFERIAASRPEAFQAVVDVLRGWMVFRDPPEHTILREPVRRAFTPKRIADLRDDIEAIADGLLASIDADRVTSPSVPTTPSPCPHSSSHSCSASRRLTGKPSLTGPTSSRRWSSPQRAEGPMMALRSLRSGSPSTSPTSPSNGAVTRRTI